MDLKEQLNGIQHIGIPTNDIEATIDFYKALGFEIAFRTVNEEADEEVAFLKFSGYNISTIAYSKYTEVFYYGTS